MSHRRTPAIALTVLTYAATLLLGCVLVYRFSSNAALRRIDDRLSDVEQVVVTTLEREQARGGSVREVVLRVLFTGLPRIANVVVRINSTGEFVDSHDNLQDPNPSPVVFEQPERPLVDSLLRNAPAEGHHFQTLPTATGQMRLMVRHLRLGEEEITLGILISERERLETLRELRAAWPWVLLVLLLATGVPLLYVRRGARAMQAMEARAREIGRGHPGLRFPDPSGLGPAWSRLVESLNLLLERAEQSGEDQRTFMATAAHELRTPVAVISGEAQVALDNEDADARSLRGSLRLIRQEARALTRIVEELFLLARMRAREAMVQAVPLYVDELLEDAAASLRRLPGATERLVVRVEPGDYPWRGDEALLTRAIANLVVNALRHAPEPTPVELHLARVEDGYQITVTDQGPGIPPAEQPRLFDRFFRGGQGRRHADGAGLGLAITRGVVEAHGGTVQLVSSGPEGSRFRIDLPLAAGDVGVHRA